MSAVALGMRDRGGRDGTGTAALVALDATATVVERRDVDLAAGMPYRRVFHGDPDPAAIAAAASAAAGAAHAALTELVGGLRGDRLIGVALPVGAPGPEVLELPLRQILGSHSLVHAAEAELYRDALATAAETLGVPVTRYPVRGPAAAPGMPAHRVAEAVAAIGRRVGRPWRREYAEAAAAALLQVSRPAALEHLLT